MSTDAEERLMVDLFRGYNSLVQPVPNKTAIPLIVKIAMQLVLLINVVSHLFHPRNVSLFMELKDFRMRKSRLCRATFG